MLLIWKHDLELSELSDNLIQGRGLSLLIKKNLEVLLSRGYPDTTEGQGYRQRLLEGYRLVGQLIHSLDPGEEAQALNKVPSWRDSTHTAAYLTTLLVPLSLLRDVENSGVLPEELKGRMHN